MNPTPNPTTKPDAPEVHLYCTSPVQSIYGCMSMPNEWSIEAWASWAAENGTAIRFHRTIEDAIAYDLAHQPPTAPPDSPSAQEPDAGQSYDVHLKAKDEEIAARDEKITSIKIEHENIIIKWAARYQKLRNERDELRTKLEAAETKARELGEALREATIGKCRCVGCQREVNNAWRDSDGHWCLTCLAKQRDDLDEFKLKVSRIVSGTGMLDQKVHEIRALLQPTPAQEQAKEATSSNDSSSAESSGASLAQRPQDVRCHRTNSEQSDGSGVLGKPEPVSVPLNNEASASPAVASLQPAGEGAALLPFDLAKALAGARAVSRGGYVLQGIKRCDTPIYVAEALIDGMWFYILPNGQIYPHKTSKFDLFLAP